MPHEKKLNARQRLFVKAYLINRNATQAAITAGYSAHSAQQNSSDLLLNPVVKAEIEKGISQLEDKLEATAERTIREIARIAHLNLSDLDLKKYSHNKLKALELLGKHFKLFTEKHEHSGPNGNPIEHRIANMTREEMEKRLAELRAINDRRAKNR